MVGCGGGSGGGGSSVSNRAVMGDTEPVGQMSDGWQRRGEAWLDRVYWPDDGWVIGRAAGG